MTSAIRIPQDTLSTSLLDMTLAMNQRSMTYLTTEWCRQNTGQYYLSWPYDDVDEVDNNGVSSVAAACVLSVLAFLCTMVLG